MNECEKYVPAPARGLRTFQWTERRLIALISGLESASLDQQALQELSNARIIFYSVELTRDRELRNYLRQCGINS